MSFVHVYAKILNKIGILGHAVEGRFRIGQQCTRRVKLCYLTLIQHNDLIRVQDGIQTMGYGQHGTLPELTAYGFLQEI